jgi:hypothetical protein
LAWKIEYLEESGIVFIETDGPTTFEQTSRLCEEVHSFGRQKGAYRFLVDHRGKDITMGILDINKIPGMIKSIGAGNDDRIAVLYETNAPKSSILNYLMHVLYLNSFNLQIFSDKDKAITWLKSR